MKNDFSKRLDLYMKMREKALNKVEMLETELAEAKLNLAHVENDSIPELFHEYGFTDATLEDGRKVSLVCITSVTTQDRDAVIDWLDDNGYGAVLSTIFSFKKGAPVGAVRNFIEKSKIDCTEDITVHPQTLKKVVLDHIAEGKDFPPEDIIKIKSYEMAKIKAV